MLGPCCYVHWCNGPHNQMLRTPPVRRASSEWWVMPIQIGTFPAPQEKTSQIKRLTAICLSHSVDRANFCPANLISSFTAALHDSVRLCFPWRKWQHVQVQTVINGRELLSFWTTLRHVKCILQVIQVVNATRMTWPRDSMGQSFQSWVPFTNSWSPVQLVLNINELTDLNGGPPVPLLSRGSPVPLEKPIVFACSVRSWVPLLSQYTNGGPQTIRTQLAVQHAQSRVTPSAI